MNDKFITNFSQTTKAIQLCIDNNLQIPTLILIYSTIDSLAYIAYEETVKIRYTKWIEKYMYINNKDLANDLYSARCAILHTQTPNSSLSEKKYAKIIAYAWGTGSAEELRDSVQNSNEKNIRVVHINELFETFKNGLNLFYKEISNSKAYNNKIRNLYSHMSKDTIKLYNNIF